LVRYLFQHHNATSFEKRGESEEQAGQVAAEAAASQAFMKYLSSALLNHDSSLSGCDFCH
jgi:hypothetical protein